MVKLNETEERDVKIELARRDFWEYCRLRLPTFYKEDRHWLRDLCERMQAFWEQSDKRIFVINMAPRFGKSLTGQMFTEWIFGQTISNRVITVSYNEILATVFAKKVRNTIQIPAKQSTKIQFADIFPDTKVSKKDAAAGMWSLEGSPVANYLATSPGGTATGVGANLIIIDDLIKNDKEALNEKSLDDLATFIFDTMMSRLEGDDWKIIVIMQRWSTQDIAGKFLRNYDCEHVNYPAYTVDEEGKKTFLCPEILSESSWEDKTKEMSSFIERAIFTQDPVDIQGRLYNEFNTYPTRGDSKLVVKQGEYVYAVTDTADKGTDSLCTYIYIERDGVAYILDYVLSDAPMEITEVLVAEKYDNWGVKVAFTEENNGGRLFARNVRRLMENSSCVFINKVQTANKESRIILSSGWVQQYVWFPEGWEHVWSDLYREIMSYNAKGKNEHDDAVDALCYVFMMCTKQAPIIQREYEGDFAYATSPNNSDYLVNNDFQRQAFGQQREYKSW